MSPVLPTELAEVGTRVQGLGFGVWGLGFRASWGGSWEWRSRFFSRATMVRTLFAVHITPFMLKVPLCSVKKSLGTHAASEWFVAEHHRLCSGRFRV